MWTLEGGAEEATCEKCRPAAGLEARPLLERLPDLSGRKALSKSETADVLGMSVDHLERHVMHELRVIQAGARVLIPVDELDAYVRRSAARALKEK